MQSSDLLLQQHELLHSSKLDIRYQGDPIIQPLRSYENPRLVQMLFSISERLNHMVSVYLC